MNKILRYYKTPNGKSPFAAWIKKIKDHTVRSRIERRLERLEIGHYGDCEVVESGIYELRLHFGPGYRIYFAESGETIVIILCGGDKSNQSKDIEKAKQYWQELRGRQS